MQASSLPANTSSTTASGGSLGNNDNDTPKVITVTATSKPSLPPQLLVNVRQIELKKVGGNIPKFLEVRSARLMFARARVENMTYNEALEEIIDSSGWRGYGALDRLRATFLDPAVDEDANSSYITEKDWSLLVKHATALYLDFKRSKAWFNELPLEEQQENEGKWGHVWQ